jgi:hypothetical protein
VLALSLEGGGVVGLCLTTTLVPDLLSSSSGGNFGWGGSPDVLVQLWEIVGDCCVGWGVLSRVVEFEILCMSPT